MVESTVNSLRTRAYSIFQYYTNVISKWQDFLCTHSNYLEGEGEKIMADRYF